MLFQLGNLTLGGFDGDFIVEAFEAPGPSMRFEDIDIPLAHGSWAGRDYLGSSTWTLTLATNSNTEAGALALSEALASVWRQGLSLQAGEVLPLRYRHTDTETWRVVYGRPRRFQGAVPGTLTSQGRATIVVEFLQTDPLHYSDGSRTVTIPIVHAPTGGLVFPAEAPFLFHRQSSIESRSVVTTGSAATPLRLTFRGPVANPRALVNGHEVALWGSLAYDRAVTVDSRTGLATWDDGSSAAHLLSRRTRIDALRVDPGSHVVSFSGTDPTGTASLEVSYSDAYYGI